MGTHESDAICLASPRLASPRLASPRLALVALSLFAYSAHIAAAPSQDLLPSAGARFEFGGPINSSRFQAQLSFRNFQATAFTAEGLQAVQPVHINTLTFDASAKDGKTLLLLGTPVLAWDQSEQSKYALKQNGQSSSNHSWVWWAVGAVAVVAVVAVAAGGGNSDDKKTGTDGNMTNCGVDGTVVGAGNANIDPNCLP